MFIAGAAAAALVFTYMHKDGYNRLRHHKNLLRLKKCNIWGLRLLGTTPGDWRGAIVFVQPKKNNIFSEDKGIRALCFDHGKCEVYLDGKSFHKHVGSLLQKMFARHTRFNLISCKDMTVDDIYETCGLERTMTPSQLKAIYEYGVKSCLEDDPMRTLPREFYEDTGCEVCPGCVITKKDIVYYERHGQYAESQNEQFLSDQKADHKTEVLAYYRPLQEQLNTTHKQTPTEVLFELSDQMSLSKSERHDVGEDETVNFSATG